MEGFKIMMFFGLVCASILFSYLIIYGYPKDTEVKEVIEYRYYFNNELVANSYNKPYEIKDSNIKIGYNLIKFDKIKIYKNSKLMEVE